MKNRRLLVILLFLLVAAPPLSIYGCVANEWIADQAGIDLGGYPFFVSMLVGTFWFLTPALIFGEPLFMMEIGVGPNGLSGWLVTIAFYTALSFALWGIIPHVRPRRPRSHDPETPGTGPVPPS